MGGTAENVDILNELWVYAVAPFVGGAIGWVFHKLAMADSAEMSTHTD